jgi:hypothetical protein
MVTRDLLIFLHSKVMDEYNLLCIDAGDVVAPLVLETPRRIRITDGDETVAIHLRHEANQPDPRRGKVRIVFPPFQPKSRAARSGISHATANTRHVRKAPKRKRSNPAAP